jgi:hypothetical protein
LTPLRSPAQVRVDADGLAPVPVLNPELLAPLARAVHHGRCPACGADVHGVKDIQPDGSPRVQITCFGDPAHAFFFETGSGHINDMPDVMGEVRG